MTTRSDSSTIVIVPFLLEEGNYEDWRIYMENYLLAQDLWGIIESGNSCSDDGGNWRKKNAAALHAIHTTSSSHIFAQIKEIRSAKDAWNKLVEMHQEWKSKPKSVPDVAGSSSSTGGEDEMTEDSRCVELKKSICNGDWNAVQKFFVFDKSPLDTLILSEEGYTALHIATRTGQDEIAEELIKMTSETLLELKDSQGHTVLTLVANVGRTSVAKCIVQKNKNLLTIANDNGFIPVTCACAVGQKETTHYLYSVTPHEVLLPQNGNHGFNLIRWSIANKMLDICFDVLQRNPMLAVTSKNEKQGESPILVLARQPSVFFSGCKLRFWQMWIYHWLKIERPTTSLVEVQIAIPHDEDLKEKNNRILVFGQLHGLGSRLLNFFGIKHLYDLKLTHLYAREILRCMCNHVSTLKSGPRWKWGVIDAMFEATRRGIVEFIIELLKITQPIYFTNNVGRHVFMTAIKHRQEKIFNLIYGIHEAWKARFLNHRDNGGNNMLHVAGEIAPEFQLAQISSPALQMQRELQWFKEVERIVPEWCKESKNKNGETPHEVFSKSHKELVKDGGKWMEDTAKSFIIAGTLIVTIMFAVAFTVPGGNDQNTGFPIFLQKRSFMTFIISDAVSFFAASTSVLMFLGIQTSRFAQEDFLVSLPKKLIIGLSTLFISVAAMMVSFCAALLIMLQDRWWAIIPTIMMASIPVALFIWLQFPRLVEIFVSTYAPGIFNRKMKPWLRAS